MTGLSQCDIRELTWKDSNGGRDQIVRSEEEDRLGMQRICRYSFTSRMTSLDLKALSVSLTVSSLI